MSSSTRSGGVGPCDQFDGLGAVAGDQDAVLVLEGFEQLVDIFRDVVDHQQVRQAAGNQGAWVRVMADTRRPRLPS